MIKLVKKLKMQERIPLIKRNSIVSKFLMTFLLILVLPIFLVSVVTNSYVNNQLIDIFEKTAEGSFNNFANSIEYRLKRLALSIATVSEHDNGKLVDMITLWSNTTEVDQKFELSDKIDSSLSLLFNFSEDIKSVVFFLKDGSSYSYKNRLLIPETKVRNQTWYKEILERPGKSKILGNLDSITSQDNDKHVITAATSPLISKYRGNVELIYIEMGTDIIAQLNKDYFLRERGEVFIVDENLMPILSNKEDYLVQKIIKEDADLLKNNKSVFQTFTKKIDGTKKMIATYKINNVGWTIISVNDYSLITDKTNSILRPLIYVLIFTITTFLIYSIIFFSGIIGPINNLIKNINIVRTGNFKTELKPLRGNSEITELSNSYISMIKRTNELMIERDMKEKQRSEAEIKALQAQINPHFIFNTLNSIKLMALLVCADNIKITTEALMNILLATFRDTNSLITIKTEIDILNNYIYIMKVRYGDKFDFECNIDEDIKELFILKMLLQPIVENAISHGVISIERRGLIRLSGYRQEDKIIFDIEDNGCGMSQEAISELLNRKTAKIKGFTGIGVNNVNQRLKLNYGSSYGIEMSSREGEFTKVTLMNPIIDESGDEK